MKIYCCNCLHVFESDRNHAEFCSPKCRKDYIRAEKEYRNAKPVLWHGGRPSKNGHCFDLGLQEERR